jgi:hypothetical protein
MSFKTQLCIRLLITFNVLFLFVASHAQQLQNGYYKGVEAITVSFDKTQYWPGIYNFGDSESLSGKNWHHEVIISVQDSFISIKKRPFYIQNGKVTYSDSTGGFYNYQGTIYKVNDTTFNLRGDLLKCIYCPRTATATPRYVHAFYVIHLEKNTWKVDTPFEKSLTFAKE